MLFLHTLVLCFSGLVFAAQAQSDPVFVLSPEGHASTIIKVFANKEKEKVISLSMDKSIGIWNTKTWKLEKKLWLDAGISGLGQILDGHYNKAKDLLAVLRTNSQGTLVVNLIDMNMERVVGTFSGFSRAVGFVRIAPSGTFIVTGSWQSYSGVEDFKLWKIPDIHEKTVFEITTPTTIQPYRATLVHDVSVGDNKFVYTDFDKAHEYEIVHDRQAIPEFRFVKRRDVNSIHHVMRVRDNIYFAGSHQGVTSRFTENIDQRAEISTSKERVFSIATSPDRVAVYLTGDNHHVKFYDADGKALGKRNMSMEDMSFVDQSIVVFSKRSRLGVYDFIQDTVYYPYGEHPRYRKIGFGPGNLVAFNDFSTTFNFNQPELVHGAVDSLQFNTNKKKFYEQKLSFTSIPVYWERPGKKKVELWVPAQIPTNCGFTNKGEAVVVMENFHHTGSEMNIFNTDNEIEYSFQNTDDLVLDFCPSKNTDQNYVATYSQNEIVSVFNVDTKDYTWSTTGFESMFQPFSVRLVKQGLEVTEADVHLVALKNGDIITKLDSMETLDEEHLTKFIEKKRAGALVKLSYLRGTRQSTTSIRLNKYKVIAPLASVYADGNEWLCWNPRGYYATSLGGEKLGGWLINGKVNDFASFHPIYDFKKEFYRPELVSMIVNSGSVTTAVEQYNATSDTKVTVDQNIGSKLPPTIRWVAPAMDSTVSRPQMVVTAMISSQSPIHSAKVLLNGRTVVRRDNIQIRETANAGEYMLISHIDLPGKENVINLYVENENGSSLSAERTITLTQTQQGIDRYKPNLYMVTVGISKHATPQYALNYAHADAEAMANLYNAQKGKLYNEVFTKVLLDEQATRSNILDAFYWLEKNATQKDVAVIFIASHGLNEKDKFYILPYDGDPERIRITGVDWVDFADVLGNLPSKVLVFIDACHSGKLGANLTAKRGDADITNAIRALATEENGVVIMSASTGKESSFENPTWGYGAFTLALLEGLEKGKADLNHDNIINVREIDYFVSERVKELTGGIQHPATQKPSVVGEFPLVQTKD